MANTMGSDGHFGGGVAILLRPEYGLRVLRGFEVGAEISYWGSTTDERALHVLVPALVLRPYIPLGVADSTELGIHLHGGVSTAWIANASGSWFGFGLSGGPDVRIWTSPSIGFQIGAEFFTSSGHNSDPQVRDPYLREDGRLLALVLWLGLVARL